MKAVGREGWRERCCDRESIRYCRKLRGGGAEEEEERESVSVLPEKNEELQRERERESEGREEGALLFD